MNRALRLERIPVGTVLPLTSVARVVSCDVRTLKRYWGFDGRGSSFAYPHPEHPGAADTIGAGTAYYRPHVENLGTREKISLERTPAVIF